MSRLPWYHEGVNFGCTQCGRCCTGGPGAVWIRDEEIARLAVHYELSIEEFTEQYTRLLDGRRALREVGKEFDCIFLKDKKQCSVYTMRPLQCQTFPFWPGVMESKKQWQEAAEHCEGIREDAPLVSYEQIQEQLDRHL